MDVYDKASAEAWLRAWGGKPGRGYLGAAIDGMRMRKGAMCESRYSPRSINDSDEALEVLEKAREALYPAPD